MRIILDNCQYTPGWDQLQEMIRTIKNDETLTLIKIDRQDKGVNYRAPGIYDLTLVDQYGRFTDVTLEVYEGDYDPEVIWDNTFHEGDHEYAYVCEDCKKKYTLRTSDSCLNGNHCHVKGCNNTTSLVHYLWDHRTTQKPKQYQYVNNQRDMDVINDR